MGDSRFSNGATSFPLPPGAFFSFHPSEELLISYYLTSKNFNLPRHGIDVIKEVDLYKYNPFDLPETACFQCGKEGRRKHWFCYVRREEVERPFRAAGNGFWIRSERVRNVIGGGVGRVVVGTRKTFVFYLGNDNSSTARKTEWLMHEYELIAHPKGSFVLCRVFVKSDPGKDISDREYTLHCENSVETELRLGVQHDNSARVHHCGCQRGGAVSDEGNESNGIDSTDDIYNVLFGQASELQDQNISNPVAQQMRPLTDAPWATMANDSLANQQLADIFRDDFVELNDLTWPLQGFH